MYIHHSVFLDEEELSILSQIRRQWPSTPFGWMDSTPTSGLVAGISSSLINHLTKGNPPPALPPGPAGGPESSPFLSLGVKFMQQHIKPNGPYIIFRSFCDAVYPNHFSSFANLGFYTHNAPSFSSFVSRPMMTNERIKQRLEMGEEEDGYLVAEGGLVYSYIEMYVTACCAVNEVIYSFTPQGMMTKRAHK